jgi:hypothetical protein
MAHAGAAREALRAHSRPDADAAGAILELAGENHSPLISER